MVFSSWKRLKRLFLFFTSNQQLVTSNHGFAVIPLIVLMVVGIAAGTLLVQTRTSFLPKAQGELIDCTFAASLSDRQTRIAEYDKLKKCPIQEINISHAQILSSGKNITMEQARAGIENGNIDLDHIKIWCSLTPSQCPAQQPAPATSSTEVPDVKCSDPNHPRCTTNSVREYGIQKGVCYMINSNLRCAYSQNYQSYDSSNGPCNAEDNRACSNKGGCTLVKVTIKGQTEPIQYSICKNDLNAANPTAPRPAAQAPVAPATQPRPAAAPQQAQGAPAAQPQSASCASAQDPWDVDKRGNSSKVSYVLKKAAEASGKAAQSASTPTMAGNSAKQEYVKAFNQAYAAKGEGFGVDISRAKSNGTCADNSATTIRDQEANNTAIHAYVLKKNPNINWEAAKSSGLVDEAIRELKLTNARAADISSPYGPSTKLVIDPATAVECGYTVDNIAVPCYQIGVFADYDTLKATEAQATVATQRYVKSRVILEAVRARVNNNIIEAAAEKLAAAERAAKACLQ